MCASTYRVLSEKIFARIEDCAVVAVLVRRCSRRILANVLRKSVLELGVYLNERSRIDFICPSSKRALQDRRGGVQAIAPPI